MVRSVHRGNGLAYSVAADVKPLISILAADISYDTEITSWIAMADADIDSRLMKQGVAVPLLVIPAAIKWTSVLKAAATFREARQTDDIAGRTYRRDAESLLSGYLAGKYHVGTFVKAEDTSEVS